MRKLIIMLLILASLCMALVAVGCGNRLNLGTTTTYNATTTSTWVSGGN